jgi:hypothetical protein
LVTDYLMSNDTILEYSFKIRREILLKNFQYAFNTIINDTISINIHKVLENDKLIDIFKANFLYKDSLNCIEEVVDDFKKTRTLDTFVHEPKSMIIEKSNITEIYNVFEMDTNNYQGVLYIKTLVQSKALRKMFLNNDKQVITCEYNTVFNKFSPVLN